MKAKRLKNGKREISGFVYENVNHQARSSAKDGGGRPQFHSGGGQGGVDRIFQGKNSSMTSTRVSMMEGRFAESLAHANI